MRRSRGSEAATADGSFTSGEALAPGTYYVQVEDMFDGTSESHWDDKWHFSNLVQVIEELDIGRIQRPVARRKDRLWCLIVTRSVVTQTWL